MRGRIENLLRQKPFDHIVDKFAPLQPSFHNMGNTSNLPLMAFDSFDKLGYFVELFQLGMAGQRLPLFYSG